MSFDYKKIRTEPGQKCGSCGRLMQHGGYMLAWEGASNFLLCGWCLITVEGANAKGQIVEKVREQ